MLNNTSLLIAAILFFFNPVFADEQSVINISDAWISEAPPTVSILAAYASIENTSSDSQTLTSVSSPFFSKVELHLSKVINDTAKMEKQDSLTIPENSTISLTPGAYHLMLFYPEKQLKADDEVMLEFNFADGTTKTVKAIVKKRNGSDHEHHHHHH